MAASIPQKDCESERHQQDFPKRKYGMKIVERKKKGKFNKNEIFASDKNFFAKKKRKNLEIMGERKGKIQ
jgi:hypothetical protein